MIWIANAIFLIIIIELITSPAIIYSWGFFYPVIKLYNQLVWYYTQFSK